MLARSFLFKLLNFQKSSRFLLICVAITTNSLNFSTPTARKFQPSSLNEKNSSISKSGSSLESFKRTPSWPL